MFAHGLACRACFFQQVECRAVGYTTLSVLRVTSKEYKGEKLEIELFCGVNVNAGSLNSFLRVCWIVINMLLHNKETLYSYDCRL